MSYYLLLRNNRESGPFTLEELITAGLKPYDLVWVQDRSAAWRYPSEIAELKAYAPVVEEQPFDRFYKRPSEMVKPVVVEERPAQKASSAPEKIQVEALPTGPESTQIKQVTPLAEKPKKEETNAPEITEEHRPYAPKPLSTETPNPRRNVFVTMPGANNKTTRPAQDLQSATPAASATSPAPTPSPAFRAPEPPVRVTPEEAKPKVKFSQPLEEIKERYARTLQERKQKPLVNDRWKDIAKKAAVVTGLIGVGLLAGFMMKSTADEQPLGRLDTSNNSPVPGSLIHQAAKDATELYDKETQGSETEQLPIADEIPEPGISNRQVAGITGSGRPGSSGPVTEKSSETSGTKTSVPETGKPTFDENKFAFENSISNGQTGERSRKTRETTTESTEPVVTVSRSAKKSDWEGKVSVASNDYKRVAFGGIRNLQLTVTNHSNKTVENVVVLLEYLKPSEEPLRSEEIRFKKVEPNSSATLKVPDTNRGIKVSYRIIQVSSASSHTPADEVASF